MKTQNDILTDIYKLILVSPINALNGGIYKNVRPTDSELEDCVVSLINGVNGKFLQDGNLQIKIFYNDIINQNTYYEDTKRGGELEKMLYDFSQVLFNYNGISFYYESRQTYTQKVVPQSNTEIKFHQHYTILKTDYKI